MGLVGYLDPLCAITWSKLICMVNFTKSLKGYLTFLAEGDGVSINDLGRIIDSFHGHPSNCYSGMPGFGCFDISYFVSLKSKKNIKGYGHLTFRQILEKVVQHMQGTCKGRTQLGFIITDNWDPDALEDWKHNLAQIMSESHLEAYLLTGRSVSPINLRP